MNVKGLNPRIKRMSVKSPQERRVNELHQVKIYNSLSIIESKLKIYTVYFEFLKT